jgi:hypothetical protein
MKKTNAAPTLVVMLARMLNRTASGSSNSMTIPRNEELVSKV